MMTIRLCWLISLVVPLSVALGNATASTSTSQSILLTANLSVSQVKFKLNPVGDKKAPHPFYQHQCAMQKKAQNYSQATGQGVFWFNPNTNILKFAVTYKGLSGSAIMAHIHFGKMGVNGPIVQTICGKPSGTIKGLGSSAPPLSANACSNRTSGFYAGTYKLAGNAAVHLDTQQERDALLHGELYINFHTCLNENGELRGQIIPLHSQ